MPVSDIINSNVIYILLMLVIPCYLQPPGYILCLCLPFLVALGAASADCPTQAPMSAGNESTSRKFRGDRGQDITFWLPLCIVRTISD